MIRIRSKEEYYQLVLQNRTLVSDPEVMRCTCSETLCEWHGRCRECIALHRHHGDHIPACLQPMLRDKVQALARLAEMNATAAAKTSVEYRYYVRERDAEGQTE